MTREAFKHFLRAVERSPELRKQMNQCKSNQGLLELAKNNGFIINFQDVKEDLIANKIDNWFHSSKINPIK